MASRHPPRIASPQSHLQRTSAVQGSNSGVIEDLTVLYDAVIGEDLAVGGNVTIGGTLTINGLTYTWPASQAAPRVLRNSPAGTLSWSLVDLSTDVTGVLATGTVPATQVTNGAYPGNDYSWLDADVRFTYDVGTGLEGEFGFYGGAGLAIYDGGYIAYDGTGTSGAVAIGINGDTASVQPIIAWQEGFAQKFALGVGVTGKLTLGHGVFTADLTLDSAGLFAFQNAVDFLGSTRILGNVYVSRIDTATAGAGDLTLWRNGVSKLTLGNALADFADAMSAPAIYSTVLDSNGPANLLLKYNAVTVLTLNTTTATFSGSVTATELFAPTVDSGSAVDLLLQRNNSTKLTLGNALATFVNEVVAPGFYSTVLDSNAASDLLLKRNGTTQLTLASAVATFLGTVAATEFRGPSVDSASATDLLLQRNNVTQLTLGSSVATFVGTVAATEFLSTTVDSGAASDLVLQRNNVTKLTLGNALATFVDPVLVSGTTVTLGANALASDIGYILNAAAGQNREIIWRTGGSNRWSLRANNTAEGGANAGSDLTLVARDDAGATIDTVLTVARAAGGLVTWVRRLVAKRFIGNGTAHVAGDYTASAGWGTTRSVSAVSAMDTGGRVTITCNGASIAANPTVTLTFKDGTWTTIPAIVITRGDGTAPTTGFWALTTASATAPVFTFFGTPVAGSTYTFDFEVMGK